MSDLKDRPQPNLHFVCFFVFFGGGVGWNAKWTAFLRFGGNLLDGAELSASTQLSLESSLKSNTEAKAALI